MYRGRYIAVVIPIHNERCFISRTIKSVPEYVDRLIVVDDSSTDGTAEEVLSLGSPRIDLIRHERNLGVGASIVSGYRHALQIGADIAAVMDGDGQMHPEDLAGLLDAVCNGAGYAKGNRFLHNSINCMPIIRYLGNSFFSGLTRIVLGLELDSQCGYTAVCCKLLRSLCLEQVYPRYGYLNSLLFQIVEAGATVSSVPVRTIYGKEVSGINPFVTVPTILTIIFFGWLRRLLHHTTISPELIDSEHEKSSVTD